MCVCMYVYIDFACGYSVVPAPFVEKTLLHCIPFASLSEIRLLYLCGSVSALYSFPLIVLSSPMNSEIKPTQHCKAIILQLKIVLQLKILCHLVLITIKN